MKPGMGIVHGFFVQMNHLVSSCPQIWTKADSLRATLALITRVHDCRLTQKHSKVKFDLQTLIIKPGMGIVHGN